MSKNEFLESPTCKGLLSIIVKTYKRPRHLDRLIQSAKKYYPEIPLFVADDSPEPYPRNDVSFFILPPESGLSAGRNFLLNKVRTKYVLLLDDDHIIVPETNLDKMVSILEKNPALDLVAGDFMNQGVSRHQFHGIYRKKFNFIFHYQGNSKGAINGYPLYDVVHNFFVARTDRLKEIGWDEEIKFSREHADFFLRAKGRLNITHLPEFFVNHFSNVKMYMGTRGLEYIKRFKSKWHIIDKITVPSTQPISLQYELLAVIKYFIRTFLYQPHILSAIQTGLGFLCYLFGNKKFILILSTQRSGSTLLTQLLGQAPDVSLTPENEFFITNKNNKFLQYYWASKLSKKKIIILKFPASIGLNNDYPKIISFYKKIKVIFLFRSPSSVVKSIHKLDSIDLDRPSYTEDELLNYWLNTNKSILKELNSKEIDFCPLPYEDLCYYPEKFTSRIFAFIGSKQTAGIKSYKTPKNFEWLWSKGDNSEKLRSLEVRNPEISPEINSPQWKECNNYYLFLKKLQKD